MDARAPQWIIHLRWMVLASLVTGCTLAAALGAITPADYQSALLLAGLVIVYNSLFAIAVQRVALRPGAPRPSTLVAWLQPPADVLALTLLLHVQYTGGISPFTILYCAVVLCGITLLPQRGFYALAAFASACYAVLVGYELFLRPVTADEAVLYYFQHSPQRGAIALSAILTLSVAVGCTAFIASRFAARLQNREAQNRRQLADLTALHNLSRDLASSLTTEDVVQKVVTAVGAFVQPDAVSLALLRTDGEAELHGGWVSTADPSPPLRLPADNPLVARLRAGEPIIAPVVDAMPGLRTLLVLPDTMAFYSFPLQVESETIGTLNLSFNAPTLLAADTQSTLDALAHGAALALARVHLYQEATRSALEMSSLYRIGLATASSLQIGDVLTQIYQQVQRAFPTETFFIALYNAEADELRFELVVEHGQTLTWKEVPLSREGMTSWVAHTRQPLLIRHRSQEETQLPHAFLLGGLNTESILTVPLLAKDKVVGVMSAQHTLPNAFDNDSLRLFQAVAAQTALALENARLHEEVRERTLRDSLTGVLNHGALISRLDTTLIDAAAGGQPVGLIMLDIDHFKAFNDRWGHQAGDQALQALAATMRANLRPGDSVGRWGGEEFAAILPGATLGEATGVATRIRYALEGTTLVGLEGQHWPGPTVSQGVASYPHEAQTAVTLVEAADRALYAAKARGRNRIVVSQPRHPTPAPAASSAVLQEMRHIQ